MKRPDKYDVCACGDPKRKCALRCSVCRVEFLRSDLVTRFWSKVDRSGDCWTWTGSTNGHYGLVFITKMRAGRASTSSHRLAWELTHGPIPAGLLVCHHCDNPRCVRPDHLFLGTASDNQLDSVAKGRWHAARGLTPPTGKTDGRESWAQS